MSPENRLQVSAASVIFGTLLTDFCGKDFPRLGQALSVDSRSDLKLIAQAASCQVGLLKRTS